MDHRKLGLRVYAVAVDYAVALGLAGRLIERVAPLARVRECRVYPYPKFEDCFGIWLELASADQAAAFRELRAMLAPAWAETDKASERSVVWDRKTHGGVTPLPEAIWMHLELRDGSDENDED